MPVFLRYSGYKVFFRTNENGEPIHFHITQGNPSESSTKVWILSDGSLEIADNSSHIPAVVLRRIFRIMQDNMNDYIAAWEAVLGPAKFRR